MKTLYIYFIILLIVLIQKFVSSQPVNNWENDEEHVTNRLRHYIQRFDIIAKRFEPEFQTDLQNLKARFEESIAKDSIKEKVLLLDSYESGLSEEFADYLLTELDKQYVNEDILIHRWYVQELLPYISDLFSIEGLKFLEKVKGALSSQDLEEKFDLYADAADSLTDEFWDYVNGNPEPIPVLNAHLKFFQEFLSYQLQDCVVDKFEQELRSLLKEVEVSLRGQDENEKLRVLDIFDDMSTEFGVFVNEKVIGYEIYKFGE